MGTDQESPPRKEEDLQKVLGRVRSRMEKLVRKTPEREGVRIHVLAPERTTKALSNDMSVTVEVQKRRTDPGLDYWTSCSTAVTCELSILGMGKLSLDVRYNIGVRGWKGDVDGILHFLPAIMKAGEIMKKTVEGKVFRP